MSRLIQIAVLAFSWLCVGAEATIVGSQGQETEETAVLRTIAANLDTHRLDVRLGRVNETSESLWSSRAQLAPLASLPPPAAEMAIDAEGFSEMFAKSAALSDAGIETVLLAVGDAERTDVKSMTEFDEEWRRAPREKRVFVSFSRADHEHAKAVAASLRNAGYLTFLYVHEDGIQPWRNSVDVGRFFEQAGAKLVIDTENARTSLGVHVERATALGLRDGSLRARLEGTLDLTLNVAEGPGPCCQWCRPGGKPVDNCAELLGGGGSQSARCGPVRCGVFCKNVSSTH